MADLLDELIAPPTAFRFSVSVGILPLPIDCSFQEVSGLDQTMETEAVREGGENRLVHQLRIGDSLRVGWWITEACVMKATRRMTPWQAGHATGSPSKSCWSSAAFSRLPRGRFVYQR